MRAKGWKSGMALLAIAALLSLPLAVSADIKITQVDNIDAWEMMGQKMPARSDTIVTWLGDNKSRMDQGDTATTIIDAVKGVIYMIDHEAKTYAEMPITAIGEAVAEAEKVIGEEAESESEEAAMKQMMKSMMQMSAKVEPAEETKKIKDWDCKKYNVQMSMGMVKLNQTLWATEDVKIDYEMFQKISNAMMSQFPGFEKVMEEMKKIKGLPVSGTRTVNMMGSEVNGTLEVINISEKKAPAGTYAVPEGYEKTEAMMPGMEGD
jgi:hypothetical protein